MFHRKKITKAGKTRYVVEDRYQDPITGKWKTASITYFSNSRKAKRQAERDLEDKILDKIKEVEEQFQPEQVTTFGELKADWMEHWAATVKPQTVEREKLVLRRLSAIIGDDFLLTKITPLLIKNTLQSYIDRYNPTQSTIVHIKSTLNKVFNHAVLFNILPYSPVSAVRVNVSHKKRQEEQKRRESKFLEPEELSAFLKVLSERRNPSYYDLAIFLLFTGLRIGEASGLTVDDIDFEKSIVNVNKLLQSNSLPVSEFYYDTTKTTTSNREVVLPNIAMEAVKRCIARNKAFEEHAIKHPAKSFKSSLAIFRTEYGSPIVSHSFREVLDRVEKELLATCQERFGFKWEKHVVPHSFRHMHITYLQNSNSNVGIKEIMGRVGHLNVETTMVYTHRTHQNQLNSVKALDELADNLHLDSTSKSVYLNKYSKFLKDEIEKSSTSCLEYSIGQFREKLHIPDSLSEAAIKKSVIPKIEKNLRQLFPEFCIIIRDEKGTEGTFCKVVV